MLEQHLEVPGSLIQALRQEFKDHVKVTLGDGRSLRFWEDVWLGEESFSSRFPCLYRNSSLHNSPIISFYTLAAVNNMSWNFHFTREPSEKEMGEILELFCCLEGVRLIEFIPIGGCGS